MTLSNAHVAELLALAAEHEVGHKAKALRKASRAALMWPEEAADLLGTGRPLTELRRLGPWTASMVEGWIRDDVEAPEPPPLRRGFITLAHARRVLDARADAPVLRGDLQVHSTWSDGSEPIDVMAESALAFGHEFLAITDHTKGLPIANGMNEERLERQRREIALLRERLDRPVVLHGLEMNLSIAGDGDMDPAAIAPLGPVLGAFHSKLRVVEDQTERYVAAVRNPTIDVLAHPRGRIYNTREGLHAEWDRVFAEVAAAGLAVECDCYPDRQDLDVELLAEAAKAGCMISVGTDAHHPSEMAVIELGRAALALAGVDPAQILPCRSASDVEQWVRARR